MTESNPLIGHLEDEAVKRKERLKNLKRKRTDDSQNKNKTDEAATLPKPLFRSYKPLNENLDDFALEPSQPGDVTSQVQNQLESAKSGVTIDQLDITSLAPRKPDWDLKRDVAKKFAKLEIQTQRAIAEMIRERLKESDKTEDLAALVNAGVSNGS